MILISVYSLCIILFSSCQLLISFQVIAASQAGKHSEKRESFGETLIIDPWGTIVGRLQGENTSQTILSC